MAGQVGLVIVQVGRMRARTKITQRIEHAARLTPDGRILAVVFEMPREWRASLNVEQIATYAVMTLPSERTDVDPWEFFGNLAVRACRVTSADRDVVREICIILFRRAGEKIYTKRKFLDEKKIEAARLNTLHPVFTRDVANNVWHLENSTADEVIVRRLATLLSWPGEGTVIVGASSEENAHVKRMNMDKDLVGVPTKIDYDWANPQFAVDFTFED